MLHVKDGRPGTVSAVDERANILEQIVGMVNRGRLGEEPLLDVNDEQGNILLMLCRWTPVCCGLHAEILLL
jgi:hypothetical protein